VDDRLNHATVSRAQELNPRVALLTPYTGGNLGDAAIQDAMIANLRLRLPRAQFSGISLNCDSFAERHGGSAFPLCVTSRPFYGMSCAVAASPSKQGERLAGQKGLRAALIKRALRGIPGLWTRVKKVHAWVTVPGKELRHCVAAYRFLRTHDLLIVSGGGQLDEEWGGPWGHPFALFKWALLARIAHIPYAISSVGAGKATSATSRFFLHAALRLAGYRSYRDDNSRIIATGLLRCAANDPVVPDICFSLPSSMLPAPAGVRSISQGRRVVAISPIAYAKPLDWPYQDRALYDRYLQQMERVVSVLLKRDYFLVIFCSSLGDDASVIPELLGRLDAKSKESLALQMHIPTIATWRDLVASLQDVDFLIASRLHSTILGFVTQKPTIAISFDPKVDWVMEDVGQTDYLLQIHDFEAEDVIKALECIELHRNSIVKRIVSYQDRIVSASTRQYGTLVELAMSRCRCRN
jgi:polysaccharide pyruvyl transferase WcaK-like protein